MRCQLPRSYEYQNLPRGPARAPKKFAYAVPGEAAVALPSSPDPAPQPAAAARSSARTAAGGRRRRIAVRLRRVGVAMPRLPESLAGQRDRLAQVAVGEQEEAGQEGELGHQDP